MANIEAKLKKEVQNVVPRFESLSVWASIGPNSYSVEFHVTIDGVRYQCYEMEDKGMIPEDKLSRVIENLAKIIRKDGGYRSGPPHCFSYTIDGTSK